MGVCQSNASEIGWRATALTSARLGSMLTAVPSLFIDGEWVASTSGTCSQVVNPSDATVVTEVDVADDADIQRAIAAARRAFDETDWPWRPAGERAALLTRTAELLERDRADIARAETLNTGKALRESEYDVDDVISVFRYYAGLADKEAGRLVATTDANALSRIVYEPLGVCGLIAPWNYPLLQISWKVAPALAAGDTMVVKPSQATPLTTIHLVRLLEEAGVPKGVVNLVLGPGNRVGQALAESPDVDLVSFTGSLAGGKSIMAAAAVNVKRVALELGGKSPNIVFADADFETAVDNALTAAFLHSGQVCSAGCRLIVEDSIHDRFVDELARRADRIRLGHGTDEATETGALISADHRDRVERYIELGVSEGARLVAGGNRPTEAELQDGFYLRPTVFADCTPGHDDRARGGLRTRGHRRAVHDRGRGDPARQRHRLRPGRRRLDRRRLARAARRRAAPPRHGLDQRVQPLPAAGRVGWLQAVGHRARARAERPRRVPRGEAHLPEHRACPDRLVLGRVAGRVRSKASRLPGVIRFERVRTPVFPTCILGGRVCTFVRDR